MLMEGMAAAMQAAMPHRYLTSPEARGHTRHLGCRSRQRLTGTSTSGTRASMNNTRARTNHTNTQTRASRTQTLVNNNTNSRTNRATTMGTGNPATTTGLNTTGATSNGLSPHNYTYGSGNGARNYRAYGYGNGYRNRRYGGGYGYGRSQGNNRAIVARLRSVHASLARINHDYQGHRVRAMQAISMAIRQLSHRSMNYGGMGASSGMNNCQAMGIRQMGAASGMNNSRTMGMRQMGVVPGTNNLQGIGMRQGGGGANAGAGRRQPMSQAQSDARMSQSLRTLQGINMQLASQGNYTAGHGRASGHIQRAIHELHVALSIR